MASGDSLLAFTVNSYFPPATNYALPTVRGATVPLPLLNFTSSAAATAYFTLNMPNHYAGNGVNFNIEWACDTATSGLVGWLVSFSRLNPANQDADNLVFSTPVTVSAITTSATAGVFTTSSLNISSGTQMNSVTTGDWFVLAITNDTASNTATGYTQFLGARLVEQ